MYLWVGLKINHLFANNIIKKCKTLNKDIELDEVALMMPPHISLKISFDILDYNKNEIIEEMLNVFKNVDPFIVQTDKIEKNGNIIWVTYDESNILSMLHQQLDEILFNKFNIKQHEFDKSFMYHTTLFIDEDENKIDQMYELIKDYDVKDTIKIDTILIGESINGKIGTFKVVLETKWR